MGTSVGPTNVVVMVLVVVKAQIWTPGEATCWVGGPTVSVEVDMITSSGIWGCLEGLDFLEVLLDEGETAGEGLVSEEAAILETMLKSAIVAIMLFCCTVSAWWRWRWRLVLLFRGSSVVGFDVALMP